MKKSNQYISIMSLSIFIVGMISCNTPTDSSDVQHSTTDSIIVENKKEDTVQLIKEKSFSKISINETEFKLPNGYKLYEKIQGDLNGDGLDDHVVMIKETKKEHFVINEYDKEVDRNRRGILIYLTDNKKTILATKNLDCFSSENEDGGIYFPPELSMSIENGKLYFHYGHGRYGGWKYTFRYQNADFELIGYDASSNYGPIVNKETSINFLTKRKLIRENINQDTEDSGDEIFEDTWQNIDIQDLYKLSEIADFDELNVR